MDFIYNLLKKYFYEVSGLLIGYLVLIYLIISYDASLNTLVNNTIIRIVVYLFISLCWAFLWNFNRNNFNGAAKNKIGILFAINAENKKQKNRIKADFIEKISTSFSEVGLGDSYDIVSLSDHRSKRAISILNKFNAKDGNSRKNNLVRSRSSIKDFNRLRKKTRCHFYVYGTIKERMDIENKYVLNIHSIVLHKPVDVSTSNKIKKEMLSVFPKEISFFEKMELTGFQIAANLIFYASRYITGIAALYSGDPFIALKVHSGLKEAMRETDQRLSPTHEHIFNSINEIIGLEKYLIARHKYFVSHEKEEAERILHDCINSSKNSYDALIFLSFISFKDNRDPRKTLKYINRASLVAGRNKTWMYNKAFIFMYLHKFDRALNIYKKIMRGNEKGETELVDEILEFNKSFIIEEPKQIQSLFIIGLLYYKKMENLPSALEYFEEFAEKSKGKDEYNVLTVRCENYLSEIKQKMKLN